MSERPIAVAPAFLLDHVVRRPAAKIAPRATRAEATALSLVRRQALRAGAVEPELERLRECRRRAVSNGQTYAGPPWDATTYEVACNLLELENAGVLEPGEAAQLVAAEAPRDAGFPDERVRRKVASAHATVGDKARDLGPDLASIFDDVPASTNGRASSPQDGEDVDGFESAVQHEILRMQIREAAQARIAAERSSKIELPEPVRLDAFLAEPDETPLCRVDRLWPSGGRIVLAAQKKAGKTSTVNNLLRALADGTAFLDSFDTEQAGRVVLIDDELDPRMLRRWLADQAIENTAGVDVITLRGRLSTFDILTPEGRQRWAHHIGRADVVILDCLRPVLDALGLDENREAGRFLEAFDELLGLLGTPDALVVHHMGHGGERARGDSRILDWPDASWRLVMDAEEGESSPRFFSAYGRDVDVPEAQLSYDHATRHLSLVGGTRGATKAQRKRDALKVRVLQYIAERFEEDANASISTTNIVTAVSGNDKDVRAALVALVECGQVKKVESVGEKGGGARYRLPPNPG